MIDPISALEEVVRRAVKQSLGEDDVDPQVRRSERADLQADLAMGLARRLKKAPRVIAEQLAQALVPDELVEKVEIAGPGFLNITLRTAWLADAATRALADERLGVPLAPQPERVSSQKSTSLAFFQPWRLPVQKRCTSLNEPTAIFSRPLSACRRSLPCSVAVAGCCGCAD